MTKERPVTGFCERCARAHNLLIPVPGSGDLDFERIPARFSWCAGCDRIVGRICCWDGAAGLCPDCAALRAAQDSSLTDAVLSRSALSGLSAATDAATALGARLGQLTVSDDDQARNGWEDAWLETGIAIVRADHATETARRRGADASVTVADEEWLVRQLASRGGAWDERRQEVADRLEQVGLRIRALGAVAMPAATPEAAPAETRLLAVPMTREQSPAMQQPVREPASVGAQPTEVVPPGPMAPWPPGHRSTPPELGRPAQSVASSALHVLARPDPSPQSPTTPRPPTRPIPLRPASKDLPARRVVLALRSLETNGDEAPVRDRARRPTLAAKERPVAVVSAQPSPSRSASYLAPSGHPARGRRTDDDRRGRVCARGQRSSRRQRRTSLEGARRRPIGTRARVGRNRGGGTADGRRHDRGRWRRDDGRGRHVRPRAARAAAQGSDGDRARPRARRKWPHSPPRSTAPSSSPSRAPEHVSSASPANRPDRSRSTSSPGAASAEPCA